MTKSITPFLWFDDKAEDAANFYVSVFPSSRVVSVSRYGEAGREVHGRPAGSVMTVDFELNGQRFTALNGGPVFKFNESVSFVVPCKDQDEIDHYWDKLTAGGQESQCGWLKDRYGVSWQVVPEVLARLFAVGGGSAKGTMEAMLKMKKLDIAALERGAAAAQDHIKLSPAGKRLRVTRGADVIAESADALAMKEGSHPVVYYFPRKDVKMERLERTSHSSHCPYKGEASYYSFKGGPENAVWSYETPHERVQPIRDLLAFYPDKVSISSGA